MSLGGAMGKMAERERKRLVLTHSGTVPPAKAERPVGTGSLSVNPSIVDPDRSSSPDPGTAIPYCLLRRSVWSISSTTPLRTRSSIMCASLLIS